MTKYKKCSHCYSNIFLYFADIFWTESCLFIDTQHICNYSIRCLSGIRLSFAIVLTSRTCVHICCLPLSNLRKKLFTSTTVLVLRINKLINQSECMCAEMKGHMYVAHVCLISQILEQNQMSMH